MNNKMLVFC